MRTSRRKQKGKDVLEKVRNGTALDEDEESGSLAGYFAPLRSTPHKRISGAALDSSTAPPNARSLPFQAPRHHKFHHPHERW
ncbi:hypothetical protein B0H19DRAFT_1118257 [Mycena capillaripes]|nr:hypothetical protein B0H19DRAFT_1118257 [Mycena capillaripes]